MTGGTNVGKHCHINKGLVMNRFVPTGAPIQTSGWTAYTSAQAARADPPAVGQSAQEQLPAPAPVPRPGSPSAHAVQALVNRQAALAQESRPARPACYPDIDTWKAAVRGIADRKHAAHRRSYSPDEKAAIAELYYHLDVKRTPFEREVLGMHAAGRVMKEILEDVDKMRADNTLPTPWRP